MSSLLSGKLNKKTAQGLKKALGVVVMLSVLCALLFIAFEAHHECEGENCPICAWSGRVFADSFGVCRNLYCDSLCFFG